MAEKICIAGGGIVGLYSSLYLSKSGFDVTLIERGDICSSTSSKFHGMIHSGGRYAVTDPVSAAECASENSKIQQIASNFVDDVGGYFLALNKEEEAFGDLLIKGCQNAGIPAVETDIESFGKAEPFATPDVVRAIQVPDKVIRSFEYCTAIALESMLEGTKIMLNSEVAGAEVNQNYIEKITVRRNGRTVELTPDILINATGPFSNSLDIMVGISSSGMIPALGAMLVYPVHVVNSVLNRMRVPSDGDIIVPYGALAIAGTTAVVSPDVDNPEIDPQDLENMQEDIHMMVPALSTIPYSRSYFSTRPLVEGSVDSPRSATRSFRILDEKDHGIENYISVVGGKFTTGRLIGASVQRQVGERFSKAGSIKDPDLNSTFKRFAESRLCPDRSLFSKLEKRLGGMDDERLFPAIAASLYNFIGDGSTGT